jgi:small GTP-binding protein
MNYDKTCQILLIGDSLVGKTCLIQRYANGIFKEDYITTVGLDYYTKQEMINNLNVSVKLWDTAGQERFKALTPSFFRNAEGVVIAYDVTNSESFDNLKFWISSIKTNLFEKNIFIPIIIIGNKIDLEDMRDISKDVASAFAKENNFKYFETSAKTGEGVDEAFRDLVNQILANSDKNEEATIERKSVKIEEKKTEKQKKKGCC